jgi:hypothetical protein
MEPPTNDVERFLAMLRFDSREKLQDFSLMWGISDNLVLKSGSSPLPGLLKDME